MTRRSVHPLLAATAALALAGAATPAAAQTLASRVAAVRDGEVRLSYAARPGVCGHGDSVHITDVVVHHGDGDEGCACDGGPVRVALTVRDGRVARVKTRVGGTWRPSSDAVDLGAVPAPDAAGFLLTLAATLDGAAGEDAILPAVIADGATVWPALLRIARDHARPRGTRKTAVFWLGQEAAREAGTGLEEIVADASGDRDVRKAAIFALSQRPADEGVPALIRIARTHADRELRETAIFWLGQSDDPRALDLFEELLAGH